MIETPEVIKRWHVYTTSHDPEILNALLAETAVFESPVVHTPQSGKRICAKYLEASAKILLCLPSFEYVNEWYSEKSAVLEFVAELEGIKVNGVDIIHWGADLKIAHFKVMVRPLKAINLLHRLMGEILSTAP